MKMKQILAVVSLGMASWPLLAGDSVDQTQDFDADGFVNINVVRGEVDIRGWDDDAIRVVGTLDDDTEEFIFEVDGDEAEIKVDIEESKQGWFDDREETSITVYLPGSSQVRMSGVSTDVDARKLQNSVDIGVVSGDLYLEGGVSRITVQSVSGDVQIRDSVGRVRVKTVSGEIESVNTTGDANYSTVSGDIIIEDGGEDLKVESVSGDIEVQNGQMNSAVGHSVSGDVEIQGDPTDKASIEFDTVSGSIRLGLGGDVHARFDIETGSGSIRNRLSSDKPKISKYLQHESLRFTLGDGGGHVALSTRSGDITLSSR